VLFAVIAGCVALWCAVAAGVGLLLGWPPVLLGCLAGAAVAGTVTSTVVFRVIRRQGRS
jgi:hypothetical protein